MFYLTTFIVIATKFIVLIINILSVKNNMHDLLIHYILMFLVHKILRVLYNIYTNSNLFIVGINTNNEFCSYYVKALKLILFKHSWDFTQVDWIFQLDKLMNYVVCVYKNLFVKWHLYQVQKHYFKTQWRGVFLRIYDNTIM